MVQYREGQRLRGRNGEMATVINGFPVPDGQQQPGMIQTRPADPGRPAEIRRAEAGADSAEYGAAAQPRRDRFADENTLRQQFNNLPEVQRYEEVVPLYVSARDAADTRAGDLNLIYAFGKMMDPGSVVREGEQVLVQGTSPIAERLRHIIGSEMDGTSRLGRETRRSLLSELRSRRLNMAQAYAQARDQYSETAREYGLNPERIVGQHPAQPYADRERADAGTARTVTSAPVASPAETPETDELVVDVVGGRMPTSLEEASPEFLSAYATAKRDNPQITFREFIATQNRQTPPGGGPAAPGSYDDSALSQGLSGINEGIANTLGMPVDLATSAINLVPAGIDAVANTNLGRIEDPTLGSDWWRRQMTNAGSIRSESEDPTNQFVRRASQSVGAAAVPIAGTYSTAGRAGAALLSSLGGGIGAASARQFAPGNPLAEIGGEIVGSGLTVGGMFGAGRRMARRRAEAAVPTSAQLREQATERYNLAEAEGLTASQEQTQGLAQSFRDTALREGLLSPTGRISEAYPKAREAIRMMDDYAAGDMSPTQMQSVRRVLSDAANSTDGAEQRMASIMLREFDEFTAPLAPPLAEARGLYRRAAEGDRIGTARRLAESDSTRYGQSGLENALRTRFREMERRDITGREIFSPEVSSAIERASQGTRGSNFARNIGRMAPTGPMNITSGAGLGLLGGMIDPLFGGALTTGLWSAGTAGRATATAMTNRNAQLAELLARAGGEIPVDTSISPGLRRAMAAGMFGQAASANANYR